MWVRDAHDALTRRWGLRLLNSAMIGFVLIAAAWNWKLVDLSHDWSARERGETLLREADLGALVLGWWDTVPIVEYLQLAEGQRPDVRAINRFLIGQDELRLLILQEVEHRPVYIDSPPTSPERRPGSGTRPARSEATTATRSRLQSRLPE